MALVVSINMTGENLKIKDLIPHLRKDTQTIKVYFQILVLNLMKIQSSLFTQDQMITKPQEQTIHIK